MLGTKAPGRLAEGGVDLSVFELHASVGAEAGPYEFIRLLEQVRENMRLGNHHEAMLALHSAHQFISQKGHILYRKKQIRLSPPPTDLIEVVYEALATLAPELNTLERFLFSLHPIQDKKLNKEKRLPILLRMPVSIS